VFGVARPALAGERSAAQNSLSPLPKEIRNCPRHVPEKYDLRRIGKRGVGRGLNFYSPGEELGLGQTLTQEIEENHRILQDAVADAYLAQIVQRLVQSSDAQPRLTVRVVLDDSVNAVTLPGGFIFLNSGVILAAANEAQLAAVLAHEIAHVESRHPTRNSSKQALMDSALTPAHFLPGPLAYLVQRIRPVLLLRIRRNAEREADLLGMEYEYAAGYDVGEFAAFLRNVARTHGDDACAGMADSTCRGRIRNLERGARRLLPERQGGIVNTADFDAVRARLAELTDQAQAAAP
jgi:predicted Zn-dependent protease